MAYLVRASRLCRTPLMRSFFRIGISSSVGLIGYLQRQLEQLPDVPREARSLAPRRGRDCDGRERLEVERIAQDSLDGAVAVALEEPRAAASSARTFGREGLEVAHDRLDGA